jgi:hypothetical protein
MVSGLRASIEHLRRPIHLAGMVRRRNDDGLHQCTYARRVDQYTTRHPDADATMHRLESASVFCIALGALHLLRLYTANLTSAVLQESI